MTLRDRARYLLPFAALIVLWLAAAAGMGFGVGADVLTKTQAIVIDVVLLVAVMTVHRALAAYRRMSRILLLNPPTTRKGARP